VPQVTEIAPAKRLDFGSHQLELHIQLQRLGIAPFDHADAPGEPLRLVDRPAQFR
jgi:hypothetical protein